MTPSDAYRGVDRGKHGNFTSSNKIWLYTTERGRWGWIEFIITNKCGGSQDKYVMNKYDKPGEVYMFKQAHRNLRGNRQED